MTGHTTLGTLRVVDGAGAVRVQDRYRTDVDDLWSAITEPRRLARWIAVVEGELRLGGEFHARFSSGWDGPGRVDVCEPPQRLVLTMSPGLDDETVIEATLTADGTCTVLVIEERGLPIPELAVHGAGWQAHLEDLTADLAGRPQAAWRDRWLELTPTYERLAAAMA